jgi:hypothetical protein
VALTVCTFLWGDKYGREDVIYLHAGLKRHLKTEHRFLCMTERERLIEFPQGIERHAIKNPELLEIPGCFVRLRLFDPGWQQNRNIKGKIVCLDLDVVITGKLDRLFDRDETFVVLNGANSVNPCPFNGSVWMFEAGTHADLWTDFSLEKASKMKYYKFPDDQGWFWDRLPNAATWDVGMSSGIYSFQKRGWPYYSNALPADARMVVFPGARSPKEFRSLSWIRDNWNDRQE